MTLYTVDTANNNRLLAPAGYVHLYDAAGNQTTDTYTTNNPSGGQRTYDAENRMVAAQQFPSGKQGTTWAYYTYNGDGRRVRRKVYGVETWQVYGMDGELVAEYPQQVVANSPQKEYGYRSGGLLVTGQPYAGNANVQWLVNDHLGTPRMIVDKTGSAAGVSRHDYLPFGEELGLIGGRTTTQGYSAADGVRQKFTRKERDNETGLDFFEARYYASTPGRFTSPDEPFADQGSHNPQSWNLYTYVRNNPLRFVDPSGEEAHGIDEEEIGRQKSKWDEDAQDLKNPNKNLVYKGYAKVPSKDGKVVDYVWVNDPRVHDVPNDYQYVDTMGRAIQLFGDDNTNAHAWGGIYPDGTANPDNSTPAPGSYTGYLDTERTLGKAGYEEFYDAHWAHWGFTEVGDNYAKPQSPTLHFTIFMSRGSCCINGVPDDNTPLTSIQIHSDSRSPVNNKARHLVHDVLPRPRSWGGVVGPRRP